MSQNHTTSDGILGRNQINHTVLNNMCQNHGNVPWYCNFGVQKGIRDLGRANPHTYATWLLQTHVFFVIYPVYYFSGTYWNFFLLLLLNWFVDTSLANRLLSNTTHQVSFHQEQLHQVGFHQGQHIASYCQKSLPLDLMATIMVFDRHNR